MMRRFATALFVAAVIGSLARPVEAAEGSKGRVLLVASSTHALALKEGRTVPTGYYLDELAVPAQALIAAGYEVVFATPDGQKPVMDERSNKVSLFRGDAAAHQRALHFIETAPGLQHPRTLKSVVAAGLDGFAGIYVPGGHAPINDLMQDADLGKALRYFHEASKPTAFLCHGPVASLAALPQAAAYRQALVAGDAKAAQGASQGWQYAGYRMTIFSNEEEAPVEKDAFHGDLPFHVEDALRAAGGQVENGPKFQPFVIRDRELITGQNPASDRDLAAKLLEALDQALAKEARAR